ncbi:MAG TPA: transcriptional regulator [Nitrospiraceae bacterium]|nr:transcriptional regulator [Nitrospiraceae bacterium]
MKGLSMNLSILGKRIQSIREKKGLTQEQLEEKTGVNTKYISAVERGQKNVTIKTLEKIATGLDIELYQLFLISEEIGSEKVVKKAIESLIKEIDRTYNYNSSEPGTKR